jgi:hypothetical protein
VVTSINGNNVTWRDSKTGNLITDVHQDLELANNRRSNMPWIHEEDGTPYNGNTNNIVNRGGVHYTTEEGVYTSKSKIVVETLGGEIYQRGNREPVEGPNGSPRNTNGTTPRTTTPRRTTPLRRTTTPRRTTANSNPVTRLFNAPQSPRYYRPNGQIVPIGAPLHRHQDGTIMTEHAMGANDNSQVVTTTRPRMNNRRRTTPRATPRATPRTSQRTRTNTMRNQTPRGRRRY